MEAQSVDRPRIIDLAKNGTPPAEIARIIGIPRNTVNNCLSRARKRGVAMPSFDRRGKVNGEKIAHEFDLEIRQMLAEWRRNVRAVLDGTMR